MTFRPMPTPIARAAVLAALVAASACAANGRAGQSSSFLIVDALQASPGARPTAFSGALASDVQTVVDDVPTVLEDFARATFRMELKNPTATTGPSPINYVTLRGYRVTYSRSDGRNTPGVDVPYAFDGALTVTVGEAVTTATLVLVRAQAKRESPLRALVNGGGGIVISTFADIVFYGADQAGREVTVNARISVNFSDWGDAQ